MRDYPASDDRGRRTERASAIVTVVLLSSCMVMARAAADAAEDRAAPHPHMAAAAQYLSATPESEVALARSAAPAAISDSATVLTLTREGYQTAVQGSNGFTCLVERSWMSPFDSADFWNPKLRGPVCYNPAASHSVLKYTLYRTKLALSGVSKERMLEEVRGACDRGELPPPEPGAMSFMLSKEGYLGDDVGHWHPHLMFHVPKTDAASWGANLPGSPVVFDRQHHETPEPQTIFFVPLGKWSDGTAEHAG